MTPTRLRSRLSVLFILFIIFSVLSLAYFSRMERSSGGEIATGSQVVGTASQGLTSSLATQH